MTVTTQPSAAFTHTDLLACMSNLRLFARALTKNRDSAEDLLQDTVVRALTAAHQFEAGTNLNAWMYTILRNAHYNEIRKGHRRWEPLDKLGEPVVPPAQDSALELQDLLAKLPQIDPDWFAALLLVSLSGHTYEQVARLYDCPVGTIKSRVGRARAQLRLLCNGSPIDARTEPTH
jgi:RNA polymerase sigma-70 factor, ECF subfamily